ncbi:glycosyl hydrolase [uncultured Nocardioides sp.]|uniref:glycosyl hydrolase n=1 Tax=uncultured Nocardioides sp. TaxID=198441 RepID=UPI0026361F17|nr:glycosyl hydrolase [uncultured Nocardioides sp.]
MRGRSWLTASVTAVAVLAVLAGVAVGMGSLLDRDRDSSSGQDTFDPFQPAGSSGSSGSSGWTPVTRQAPASWTPAAARLPRVEGSTGPARVDAGLAPPTNRWYSGMFFGSEPQPVFAMPLAAQADDTGVAVGLPRVSASERTITAPFVPELRLGLAADAFTATRADPVSVTSTYTLAGTAVGELDLAEGWPYVGYTALQAQDVTVPAGLERRDGGRWLAMVAGDTTYGLAVSGSDGSRRTVDPSGDVVPLERGETLLAFAARDDATLAELSRGAVPVRGTSTGFDLVGGQARTRIDYRTPRGRSTVLAAMPHQRLDRATTRGRVDSLYGPLRLVRARSLVSSVPALRPDATPDVDGLGRTARAELRDQVVADVAKETSAGAPRQDTYFGGKDVHRMAQLTRLAEDVGADDAAAAIRERAVTELDAWLGGTSECGVDATRCFAYDTAWKGVVGRAASFGSDEFNDHHFHYGYFLATAALLGEGQPELLDRWRPTLTALAEDIASPATNGTLPALRSFDPYTAHSWASGASVFADGNNQESSSEAISAWNGMALWAAADGNQALARQATWQLSLEAASARAYWLEPRDLPAAYDHSIVSLNWGGKREWATWFSDEPSAMLGIQLLPMPAVMAQGKVDEERVRASVAEASARGFDTMFGDYLTMYLALAEPRRALEVGRRLPDTAIDDGNTRSQLLAWLLAARAGQLRGAR